MQRPPDPPPTYFVDRSLGAHDVPDALRAAGALVEVHDDHFHPDTADSVWLSEVGNRKWIVLTKDARIRRHPLELQSLLAANVAAFLLTAKNVTGADMAHILVAALGKMTNLARMRTRPFIATISRSGQIAIIHGGTRRGGIRR